MADKNVVFLTRHFGNTTYKVRVDLSETAEETMEDKILRLIRNDGLTMNGCPSTPKAPNSADKIPSRNAGTATSSLSCGGLHGQMWQTAIWSAPDMRNASTTAAMPSVGCWSSLRSMRVWLPEPWRKRVLSLTGA